MVVGAVDEILGIDVHEGFLFAARILEAGLLPRLDRSRPVHLTGHSLGGSLATLLGLRLERKGDRVSVTTFGAPKITTFQAFATDERLHRLDLIRIVNDGDVLQHCPSVMDTSGRRVYAQFGRERTLTAGGACEPTRLPAHLIKSASIVLDGNLPAWSPAAHGMPVYLERLGKLHAAGLPAATVSMSPPLERLRTGSVSGSMP